MTSAIIRGPLLSKSGYGTHTRQVYKWLKTTGWNIRTDITQWGLTSWYVNPDALDGLVGDIMQNTGKELLSNDISIQVQLPNEWDSNLAKVNVGITAGVEATKVSENWVKCVNAMDLVVVPSQFTKRGFVESGAPENKIVVIPEAFSEYINSSAKAPIVIPGLECIDTSFNFLVFGQITSMSSESDRKNIFNTVKWFCEEFEGENDVGLIIKSNLGTTNVFHRRKLQNLFSKLLEQVRKNNKPSVYLINGDMDVAEIAGLFQSPKVNALLTLTRGEGYGLPIIDAAASGLPIVATNWSGHLEFLKHGNFSKVSYNLKPVHESMCDGNIFIPDACWAEVDEQDAKKRMRKIVNSSQKPKEWASALAPVIQEKYSLTSLFTMYDDIIKGLVK